MSQMRATSEQEMHIQDSQYPTAAIRQIKLLRTQCHQGPILLTIRNPQSVRNIPALLFNTPRYQHTYFCNVCSNANYRIAISSLKDSEFRAGRGHLMQRLITELAKKALIAISINSPK